MLVVSPYHTSRARTLTRSPCTRRTPGTGLLESATTRRAGFVQIVDLAPTILDLLDVKPPDVMEGRPARLHAETGTYRARVDRLVRADRGAQFRDATIGQATAILVAVDDHARRGGRAVVPVRPREPRSPSCSPGRRSG